MSQSENKLNKKPKKARKSLKRRMANILFFLVVLLFLLAGAVVAITDTEIGFQTAVKLASPVLNAYGLDIQSGINGDLYQFKIPKLTIVKDGNIIHLSQLSLQWQPFALWNHHLSVQKISATVDWPVKSTSETTHTVKMTEKAVDNSSKLVAPNVTVDLADIQLHIQKTDGTTVGDLTGAANYKDGRLFISKMKFDGSGLKTELNGFFAFHTSPQLHLTAPWRYQHGNHDYQGTLSADGNLSRYKINFDGKSLNTVNASSITMNLVGDLQQLHSTKLEYSRAEGTANGDFKLQFAPMKWLLYINGKDLDIHPNVRLDDELLNINLMAKGDDNGQQLNGDLNLADNKVSWDILRDSQGDIAIKTFEMKTSAGLWKLNPVTVKIQPSGINIPETCFSNGQDKLCFNWQTDNQILKGNMSVSLDNLSQFAAFFPQINEINGQLQGKMNFSGTAHKPHFKGDIALKNANIGLPSLGLELHKTSLNISSKQKDMIAIKGQATSGDGLLKLTGNLRWMKTYLSTVLSVTGKQFTAVNLPEAHVVISPQLTFTRNNKADVLIGDIGVDSANIDADQFEKTAGLNSKDIVYVNADNQAIHQTSSLPFATSIQIFTNNKINFKGYNIKANIGGNINISSYAGKSTFANGTLKVNNGTYSAYGKTFKVTKGALIFSQSPLTNPALNIYAQYAMTALTLSSSSIGSIQVGVHVSGTMNKIQLSLYSDPPMTQENILSYIITGQPLNKAGPQGQAALSQAALSLAAGGGDSSILDTLKDKLALSELSVGSLSNTPSNNLSSSRSEVDQDNTAVFVGKAISKRFYISYGVGLFNQQQIFRTHLRLTKNWSLQTDNSTLDSGADIIYVWEH